MCCGSWLDSASRLVTPLVDSSETLLPSSCSRMYLDGKPWSLAPTIPLVLFALFQLKFAIITPALITGTFAERVRFKSYIIFLVLFSLLIYAPLAHMTWHPDGFLFKLGVLDFAGGTVVHMSAGFAASCCLHLFEK